MLRDLTHVEKKRDFGARRIRVVYRKKKTAGRQAIIKAAVVTAILAAGLMLLLLSGRDAYPQVSGPCADCHTMQSSQDI